jgi:hypothetical protein
MNGLGPLTNGSCSVRGLTDIDCHDGVYSLAGFSGVLAHTFD